MIITHATCSLNQQPCVIIQRQFLKDHLPVSSELKLFHDDLLKDINMYATWRHKNPNCLGTDYYMDRVSPSFLSLGQRVIFIIESVFSLVNTPLYINGTWGNKYVRGDTVKPHGHTWDGAIYAYVYNVSVCENCAPLIFPTIENGKRISLKTGQLIIFPGWLTHTVGSQKCDHPRISAIGNICQETSI